jgi:hypothetical protein
VWVRSGPSVEALARYVQEQGYADRALTVEELFAPELLDC